MKKRSYWFFLILGLGILISSCMKKDVKEVHLIPEPAFKAVYPGTYLISTSAPILLQEENPDLIMAAAFLQERLHVSAGLSLDTRISTNSGKGIHLSIENLDSSKNPEAYEMRVTGNGIMIKGNTARAVFYGVQTLLQLLPPTVYASEKALDPDDLLVPYLEIRDEPRYVWRGMHLDVGRHIFPIAFVKRYIDFIAMHKMNVFHWHLTEDQGWRIEIKKYPLLTSVGSIRQTADGGSYGGYYTQEEIREVVEYARTRFVDVMPEIEMPGHSVAALAGYPELSCTGGPFEVRTPWGVAEDVYCAGKEETFEFLQEVIAEVVDLFPFHYFHIGGDECPKTRWQECPDCQKRIQEEGLSNEHELQSYFIRRIEQYLKTKNRQLVGWDEILEGGLAPEATVMSWRGIAGGVAAAREFHDVIMSPTSHCYFDFYQGDPGYEPKAIGGFLPMEKVYSYEPTPEELTAEEAKHILGAQGNLWTEYIPTTDQAEYMVLPRMSALAEVVWTPQDLRDYELFLNRMRTHYLRLDAMEVNYRVPTPIVGSNSFVFLKEFTLELHKAVDGAKILFTTDGSDPQQGGQEYTAPLSISEDTHVKAVIRMPSGHTSSTVDIQLDQQDIVTGIELERQEGVSYSLYGGAFQSVADFVDLKPKSFGTMPQIGLPNPDTKELYGLIIRGYVQIERAGIYRFYCFSDDGSLLMVRGQKVIENDGLHGPKEVSGEIALGQGWHPFELQYFQAGGSSLLELEYSGPDMEKQAIQPENLAAFSSGMKMIRMN